LTKIKKGIKIQAGITKTAKVLSKTRSFFQRKITMKSSSDAKSKDQTTDGANAKTADPSVISSIPQLAITALAIANATDTILRNAGNEFGLADWALLNALAAQSTPQPMGRLIVSLGVTRQRVQKQIDDLQKAELVNVEGAADDKRVKNVTLTDAGRRALLATSNSLTDQLSKNQEFGEMKNLVAVQRRLSRVALTLSRMMRAEVQATGAAKKAAKLSAVKTK